MEDKGKGKPDAEKSPLELGRETAQQMGLNKDWIMDAQDAAVLQGVANFRLLSRDAQKKVMRDIDKLAPRLAGQLRGKIADMQVQPEWTPRSMKDEELLAAAERNERNALALRGLSMAPGKGVGVFGWYADQFDDSAKQMRAEIERRRVNKERR